MRALCQQSRPIFSFDNHTPKKLFSCTPGQEMCFPSICSLVDCGGKTLFPLHIVSVFEACACSWSQAGQRALAIEPWPDLAQAGSSSVWPLLGFSSMYGQASLSQRPLCSGASLGEWGCHDPSDSGRGLMRVKRGATDNLAQTSALWISSQLIPSLLFSMSRIQMNDLSSRNHVTY